MAFITGSRKQISLFLDGSKFRANASKSNTWDEVRCKKSLEIAEKNIERVMEEAEQIDKEEANAGTLVKLDEELQDQKKISGCINCGKKNRNFHLFKRVCGRALP